MIQILEIFFVLSDLVLQLFILITNWRASIVILSGTIFGIWISDLNFELKLNNIIGYGVIIISVVIGILWQSRYKNHSRDEQ